MVDWWTEVGRATAAFLEAHGLLAAFVFLLIEEAGVPVPVPGDLLMLALGVQASKGRVPLWQAIAVMELATILGSAVLYTAARAGGRGLVYRYGRFMRLTPERLDRTERWLQKHGSRAVFMGRLLPGLRIVTAVACGVFSVPVRVFVPAMSVGALLYIGVYTLLGFLFGQPVLDVLEEIHLPFGLLGSLIPLTVIVVWTVRARQGLGRRTATAQPVDHHQQLRDGAIAGGLGTIASTLLLNVAINLAGNIAFNAPGTIVERTAGALAVISFAREVQPLLLFVAVPAFLAVGVLWGALYGLAAEAILPPSMPDGLKGLCYALVPFATSSLVAMPLLGLGFFGVGATGPIALVGEIIRHAAYGVLVGLVYPVMRARRPVRVLPHSPDEVAPNAALSA